MLDLEKRTPEQQRTATTAIKDDKLLSSLLYGMLVKKCPVRYGNFKVVSLISEQHPEVLYPKWDFFEDMLKSKNNTYIFYAIHIMANLAKVDKLGKFEQIFDLYYGIIDGDALIPACHVAYVSYKIVKAKPELTEKITHKLLNLEKATYNHKELVQANALHSFSEFFDFVPDKEKIVNLAKELQNCKSARAKQEANAFVKKWNIK